MYLRTYIKNARFGSDSILNNLHTVPRNNFVPIKQNNITYPPITNDFYCQLCVIVKCACINN